MRISTNPPRPPRDIAALRAKRADFSPVQSAHPRQPAPAAAPPATSIDMLVVLAANEGEGERRRRLAADAERGLAALEALEAEVETGGPRPERLQELASWAQDLARPDDPQLAHILDAIHLRALVELAKQERGESSE